MVKYAIGLDLSLRSTGMVAVPFEWSESFDWDEVIYSSFGYDLDKGATARVKAKRLVEIANEVERFVRTYGGDGVWIENYAFNRHSSSTYQLGELGGVVRAKLYELGERFEVVTATAARKTFAGKLPRKGAKAFISSKLASVCAPFENDDEGDAFVIANHGVALSGFRAMMVHGDDE